MSCDLPQDLGPTVFSIENRTYQRTDLPRRLAFCRGAVYFIMLYYIHMLYYVILHYVITYVVIITLLLGREGCPHEAWQGQGQLFTLGILEPSLALVLLLSLEA